MRPLVAIARRLLGLPPRRFASESSTEWIALSDGVRLATTITRPRRPGLTPGPAVLIRTPARAHAISHPPVLFARILAEHGYATVVQECRGRHASEGEFAPFRDEASDGREVIGWIGGQPWFDGRLALIGFGYSGFAAWAALSRAEEPIRALVVGFAARDPHASLYPGGAFALAYALQWAVGIGEREEVGRRRLDLERGIAFRPVAEADRVTHRRVEWFRDWVQHPADDDFWKPLRPAIPPEPPPTLLIGAWNDPALGPQLDDYAELEARARRGGSSPPELVVGPWRHASDEWGGRIRGARAASASLREALSFLERQLGGSETGGAPVRVFVRGADRWRESPTWPLPGTEDRAFYLHSGGSANSLAGDGRLGEQAPSAEEPPDHFTFDPSDPVPTRGGCTPAEVGGPADQRAVESRADVLCFTTPPLPAPLEVTGRVRVVLFAASSAPDTDFTAKLVDVNGQGAAFDLCDGTLRCRRREGGESAVWLEPDRPQRLEIELWATSWWIRAGHRIRLEISSSNFPRFDRNSNTRTEPGQARADECLPARQTVYHDAEHPSHAILPIAPGTNQMNR